MDPPFSPAAPLSVSSNEDGLSPGGPADLARVPSPTDANYDPSASSNAAQPTVPAACLACRGKHLKCDGITPCSRCLSSNSECVYVASRRGYKGPRRGNVPHNPNKRFASSPPPCSDHYSGSTNGVGVSNGDSCPMLLGASPVVSMGGSMPVSMAGSLSGSLPGTIPGSLSGSAFPSTPASTVFSTPPTLAHMQLYRNPMATNGSAVSASFGHPSTGATAGIGNLALAAAHAATPPNLQRNVPIAERCFDSFFFHFHASHPFVLPRDFLQRFLAKEGGAAGKLDHLQAAIRFVGSLYLDAGPARASYLDEAIRLAYLPGTPRDGFLVQTLMLLIIGLDGQCQQTRANQLLGDCERLAIEISLNSRQFATANGRGDPMLEESWRRTWWELYVVDGMIAGVHRVTNFWLFDMAADVALPCEEHQYLSGNIPKPAYLEDLDDQLFSGEDREFSSFAYRISAARNLGRFMRCPPMLFPEDENITKVESLLTNWRMHLPPGKKDALNKNCQLDEMMFQALFINQACTILLHQPHSQLDSSPARSVNSCAPHTVVPSGDVFNAHTRHTIAAACEISRMITHAVPLLSHTHFFTCVITLSSIVHLSKWAALYFIQDEDDLRQQIRLNIGALQRISAVWKNADTAGGQVKGVAQEIYRAKKAQQISPAFWVAFTQEQMIQSLNADEGIMGDFDAMLPAVSGPDT